MAVTKQVIIVGTMTVEGDASSQPPQIWGGGNQPFPTPPIHLGPGGGNPPGIWGGGNVPMPSPPIYLPPNLGGGGGTGIWGPNDPRPSNPISGIPGLPGYEPPQGGGGHPGGGTPLPPAVNVPIDGKLVFVPGYGWMFIPDRHEGGGKEDRPHPEHPIQMPGGSTKPSGDKPPINVQPGDQKR